MIPTALLRAVLRFGDEPEQALSSNLYHLHHDLDPLGIDADLLQWLSHINTTASVVPTFDLAMRYFKDLEAQGVGIGPAAQLRLGEIAAANEPFLTGAEFRTALDRYKQQLMREVTSALLIDAATIMESGLPKRAQVNGRWDTIVLQGVEPAIDYIYTTLNDLKQRIRSGSIEGAFRDEGTQVKRQYEQWERDPASRSGVLSGISKIDTVHHGLKHGELALVMGFTSHLKTTFCLNWLYNAAIYFKRNVAICSLETPIDILRTILYVMHAAHPKFEGQLGLQTITYDKVTTGALNPEEKAFFFAVIDDFTASAEYGGILYKEPQEGITVHEIRQWAEGLHRQSVLDMLVIDYLGLVDPGKNISGMEQGANLNRVIRQAKLMAMEFGGRGIGVLSPFQANREGLKDAEKNGGRYKLTALANAHEAERSSDYVYYVYLDDQLRSARELTMGNIKARNSKLILDQWRLYAEPATRIISDRNALSAAQAVVAL